MHIKQVLISGFRSFRSQNEIESFSPQHNVIVGRNGSGKSNFFDAIQFVLLGPKFASLRQEDRQNLLHAGAGSSVMAAYVEIVFDNADGRLSVDTDEVVLRRTVGHKKDEFFLNRKRVQKSEVMSLLESAGFSKSNPYYIVQQGKVSNLCVMKDKDRLNLLKEVAGTTVYEERRSESIKIMQETTNKQEKVEEVLTFIEERLAELETEKKELTEYDTLDKQRRALEYNLYDKEYSKANEQLQQMELIRETERDRQQSLYSDMRELQDEIGAEEDTLSTMRLAVERIISRKDIKSQELKDFISRKSAIEVELQETVAAAKANKTETTDLNVQLKEVLKLINTCESELRRVEPTYSSKDTELKSTNEELAFVKHRIEDLYGKQGRGIQFSTKSERDKFLQTQIANIEKIINQKNLLFEKQSKEIESEEKRLSSERENIKSAEKEGGNRSKRYDELTKSIHKSTQHRNELQEKRKSNWRDLENIQEQIQETKQELERSKQQLSRALPKHITQGIAAVELIAQEKGLINNGYYGTVVDNFVLKNEVFRTAVEVAAGNSLFHIIVANDDIAAMFMKELDRRKAGRVTFLPLNRLHNPNISYPDSNDVRPLLTIALEYDATVHEAMKQVFGNKLLARDLETASHFSKEFNLDAITKDGDLVNRKGGYEGGFHDDRTSKIGAVMKIRESLETLQELSKNEMDIKKQSDDAENKINDILRELQKSETEREHLRTNGEQLSKEINSRGKQLQVSFQTLENRKADITKMQSEIKLSIDQVESYRKEISSPLQHKLSNDEKNELIRLEERQRTLYSLSEKLQSELLVVSGLKEKLTADLESNLVKRKDEIQYRLSIDSDRSNNITRDFDSELNNLNLEKEHIQSLLVASENELNEIIDLIVKKKSESSGLDKSLEEKKTSEQQLQEKMTEATKMLDKLLNKRSILMETIQTRQRMIRDLGTLPRKELEEFKNLAEKQLLKKLKDVNEQLKKYSSVNRKALDQYISFNEQRETLIQRKVEMDKDSTAIQQLIESLDAQKDEAILRTFRGVSHHFSEVFSELVPNGVGKLIMRTSMDENDITDNPDDHLLDAVDNENFSGSRNNPEISTFQGVQVRVSFSGTGQQYQMNQLSGGQKALVALAMIFAIQRSDPAPFYLFDEIDQALDANYRAGVARLIEKQVMSETAPAQFITTTFRPELVAVAQKCYGIALQNKVSNIYPLDKVDAQNFVTNLMLEEEAVGKVSSVPSLSRMERLAINNEEQYGEEEEKSPSKMRRVVNEEEDNEEEYVEGGEDEGEDIEF